METKKSNSETPSTPLPYEINEGQTFVQTNGSTHVLIESRAGVDTGLMGNPVCKVVGKNKEEALAIAAFIVKACNNHHELREALKEAEAELRYHHWNNTTAYNKIIAALKASEIPA